MKLIAGVDIGNSTTEVCIGQEEADGHLSFLASASLATTGTKGTLANVHGVTSALKEAMGQLGKKVEDLALVRLNEAAPVIGDTAMETLTETIITDSSMIGHNPSTPAGAGQAVGELIRIQHLYQAIPGRAYIVVASRDYSYEEVASRLKEAAKKYRICGLILQADEAVLVENRLTDKIPIVDEVARIDRVPEGDQAAIEVALEGQTIRMLSNPYGIATLLGLTPEETRTVTPIAKSLIGKRSAVVIKTPGGNVRENVLPAGEIYLEGDQNQTVSLDQGAEGIMKAVAEAGRIRDISGQPDTNVGHMLARIKQGMGQVSGEEAGEIRITDLLAVDTLAPVLVSGALAGETCLEKAVGIAAMVRTQQLPMRQIANRLHADLGDQGAEGIMKAVAEAGRIRDISGQPDTNVGHMLARIKQGMGQVSGEEAGEIRITDLLAVDTLAPVLVSGALAGETCLEKAVGIAAMVRTQQLPMRQIANRLHADLGVEVVVAGVEAVMASLGALTTPGTSLPLAILDMGGGSTDAAIIHENGHVDMIHQAGAGEMVSMLIQTELGLADRHMAEQIKRYPLAKVESLFHMRMEDGQMTFREDSIDPRFYGRVVLLSPKGLIRVEKDLPMEKILQVRREAKKKVFVTNAFRALQKVAPEGQLKNISHVVLVGGSAEDFEIPEMLMEEFSNYRIVCGRGNIRGSQGPRNAVATGLVLSYMGEKI